MQTEDLKRIPLEDLVLHPRNPRPNLAKVDVQELAASIETHGLLQPLLVRASKGMDLKKYEVLAGARRLRALFVNQEKTALCSVLQVDDREALGILLTENANHQDVDPILEAEALDQMVGEYEGDVRTVAERLGRPVKWVAARRALKDLSTDWKQRYHQRPWKLWKAAAWTQLAGLVAEQQDAFYAAQKGRGLLDYADMDPADLADELRDYVRVIGQAPFNPESPALLVEAGPCSQCPKTSQSVPGLFDDGEPVDLDTAHCRDRGCWDAKSKRAVQLRVAAAKKEHGKELVSIVGSSHTGPKPKGTRVLGPDQYVKAKKGDKGAVPALNVGSAKGAISYVKPRKKAAASNAARSPKRSLATLRAFHDLYAGVTATAAQAALLYKVAKPSPEAVLAYVDLLGWSGLGYSIPPGPRLKMLKGEKASETLQRMWEAERTFRNKKTQFRQYPGRIAPHVHDYGSHKSQAANVKEAEDLVTALLGFFGVDTAEAKRARDEAIAAYPKSGELLDAENAKAKPKKKAAKKKRAKKTTARKKKAVKRKASKKKRASKKAAAAAVTSS